ncbi:hypothetical protein Hanom_Chr09g00793471 [Helianthus anomalus]
MNIKIVIKMKPVCIARSLVILTSLGLLRFVVIGVHLYILHRCLYLLCCFQLVGFIRATRWELGRYQFGSL